MKKGQLVQIIPPIGFIQKEYGAKFKGSELDYKFSYQWRPQIGMIEEVSRKDDAVAVRPIINGKKCRYAIGCTIDEVILV